MRKAIAFRMLMLALMPFLASAGSSYASTLVGNAVTVVRDVKGLQERQERILIVDDDVFQNEEVVTGPAAAARLIFKDNTNMSIGAGSRLRLTKLVFDPDPSKSKVVVKAALGVFRFATGTLPSSAYTISTPVANISVRGTVIEFTITGLGTTTIYVAQGAATVTSHNGDAVDLEAGQSTTIVAEGADGGHILASSPTPPETPSSDFARNVRSMTLLVRSDEPDTDFSTQAGPNSSGTIPRPNTNTFPLQQTFRNQRFSFSPPPGGGSTGLGSPGADSSASSSGATSSGATSSGATSSGATSSGATSSGATSSGATSSGATSSGATSSGATSSGATSSGGTSSGSTSSGATSSGDASSGATSSGSTSSGATSSGATSSGATSSGATSSGASSSGASSSGDSSTSSGGVPSVTTKIELPGKARVGTSSAVAVITFSRGSDGFADPVTGSIAALSGVFSGPGSPAITLAADGTLQYIYKFSPTERGTVTEKLAFALAGLTPADSFIELEGVGVGPAVAGVDKNGNAGTFNFGPGKDSLAFSITNVGDAGPDELVGLTLHDAVLSGPGSEFFTLLNFAPGTVLGSGESLELLLTLDLDALAASGLSLTADLLNQVMLKITTDMGTEFGADGGQSLYYRLNWDFLVGVISEPAVAGLLVASIVGLALLRRRRLRR